MNKNNIFYIILFVVIGFLIYKICSISASQDEVKAEMEHYANNVYTKIYYDEEIETLKKENRELYDSIKKYKDEIDYLIQFKYEKKFSTGIVEIEKEDSVIEEKVNTITTFEYENNENDTLKYNLKIGSTVEPNWYSLDFTLSDNFTIVNKKINDINKIEIKSDNEGLIDNTTIIRKKEKYNFFDHIAIGPSVTCGYDFAKKESEFIVGFSITYDISDLFKKKK